MKRIIVTSAVLLALFLTACGSNKTENVQTPAPEASAAPEATVVINQAAQESNTAAAQPETAAPVQQTPAPTPVSQTEPAAAPAVTVPPAQPAAPADTLVVSTPVPAETASVPPVVQSSGSVTSGGQHQGVLGTEYSVPAGFVEQNVQPNIGYQYTYFHPDYGMMISVHELTPGDVPDGALDVSYDGYSGNPDVTFLTKDGNWFVASGYTSGGEVIFYNKYYSENGTGLKYFEITYPTVQREACDPLVAEFEKNCHF